MTPDPYALPPLKVKTKTLLCSTDPSVISFKEMNNNSIISNIQYKLRFPQLFSSIFQSCLFSDPGLDRGLHIILGDFSLVLFFFLNLEQTLYYLFIMTCLSSVLPDPPCTRMWTPQGQGFGGPFVHCCGLGIENGSWHIVRLSKYLLNRWVSE